MLAIVIAASPALAVSLSACADFIGKVVGVVDGDSITVLRERGQVKVRLVEIDAPEMVQPFGNGSKPALAGDYTGALKRLSSLMAHLG